MKPLLKMLTHSKDDKFIVNGNEVEYNESFEDCLVLSHHQVGTKRVFHLGRNVVAFRIVNEMLCGLAGRTFH